MKPKDKVVAVELVNANDVVVALSDGTELLVRTEQLVNAGTPIVLPEVEGEVEKEPGAGLERPAGEN